MTSLSAMNVVAAPVRRPRSIVALLRRLPMLAGVLIVLAPGPACPDGLAENRFSNVSALETTTWLRSRPADARVRYGNDHSLQFGDLWLPPAEPSAVGHPVIVLVHGGAWRADWSKDYATPFVEQLMERGFAVWELGFRRIGNRGGAYPQQVAEAVREILRSVTSETGLQPK